MCMGPKNVAKQGDGFGNASTSVFGQKVADPQRLAPDAGADFHRERLANDSFQALTAKPITGKDSVLQKGIDAVKPPPPVDPTDEYIRQAGMHARRRLQGLGGIQSTFLTGPSGLKTTLGS